MSCPAMQMRFLKPHQRLPSKRWMRWSSQEVLWIRVSWRGATWCCEFIFAHAGVFEKNPNRILTLYRHINFLSVCPAPYSRPSERGWRKTKDGSLVQPKLRLKQEVVSIGSHQQRGQRIVVPVKRLFAREKRPYGLGIVGRLTNRSYRKRIDSFVKRQIEDMDDHR